MVFGKPHKCLYRLMDISMNVKLPTVKTQLSIIQINLKGGHFNGKICIRIGWGSKIGT